MAMPKNGVLWRWRLSENDSAHSYLLHRMSIEDFLMTKATLWKRYHSTSVRGILPISSVGAVIPAQNVLASLSDEETVAEAQKDQLVLEFWKKQTEMLAKIFRADS